VIGGSPLSTKLTAGLPTGSNGPGGGAECSGWQTRWNYTSPDGTVQHFDDVFRLPCR
jgi:hypothetical protein